MNKPSTYLKLILPFILGLLAMTTSISIDMLIPGITQISMDFAATLDKAENIVSMFLIGFAFSQLFFGPIADAYGRRVVFFSGIILFFVANFGAAICSQLSWLLFFRFLQGLGAAAISVSINATLRDRYSHDALSRMVSLVTLVMTIAPLVGPTLGSYAVVYYGWRSIPWLCTGFSMLCFLAIWMGLPETHSKEKRTSIYWKSIIGNYRQVLCSSKARAYIFINSFSFSAMFVFITVSADLYMNTFHILIQHFGLLYSINLIFSFLLSSLNSKYVVQVGYKKMLSLGIAIQLLAVALLFCTVILNSGLPMLIVSMALLVGCVPLISSNCMTGILSDMPNISGTASALAGFIRFSLSACAGFVVSLRHTTSLNALLIVISVCMFFMIISYARVRANSQIQNEAQTIY